MGLLTGGAPVAFDSALAGLGVCLLLGVLKSSGHLPFGNQRENEGLNFGAWPLILCAPPLRLHTPSN